MACRLTLGDLSLSPKSAFGDPLKAFKERSKSIQAEVLNVVLIIIQSCSKTRNGELKVTYKNGNLSFILIFSIENVSLFFNGTKSPAKG